MYFVSQSYCRNKWHMFNVYNYSSSAHPHLTALTPIEWQLSLHSSILSSDRAHFLQLLILWAVCFYIYLSINNFSSIKEVAMTLKYHSLLDNLQIQCKVRDIRNVIIIKLFKLIISMPVSIDDAYNFLTQEEAILKCCVILDMNGLYKWETRPKYLLWRQVSALLPESCRLICTD